MTLKTLRFFRSLTRKLLAGGAIFCALKCLRPRICRIISGFYRATNDDFYLGIIFVVCFIGAELRVCEQKLNENGSKTKQFFVEFRIDSD